MINNKKGFTLVELLSVIVLIGLLIGIGVPGVMKISERMKERSYNTKVGLIEQAGTLWGQDNKTLLQATTCTFDEDKKKETEYETYSCYKITINDLIDTDYLEEDGKDDNRYVYTNPIDNSNISNTCVYVYKKNNRVYAYYDDSNNKDNNNDGKCEETINN